MREVSKLLFVIPLARDDLSIERAAINDYFLFFSGAAGPCRWMRRRFRTGEAPTSRRAAEKQKWVFWGSRSKDTSPLRLQISVHAWAWRPVDLLG
jgi:hypothetical protein